MARLLPISKVAEELNLSPRRVHALIDAQQLPAERAGRSWFVSEQALERFRRRERRRGRPLTSANAWALLALLAGDEPAWVRPDARSRLRRYARDPKWLLSVLEHSEPRAEVRALWVAPEDLPKLAGFPLIRSGLSAERAVANLDVIPHRNEPIDVYASAEVAHEILRRFAPEEDVSDPNLILRIADFPLESNEGEAPLPVAAADLIDHDDPRVRRASEKALQEFALAS